MEIIQFPYDPWEIDNIEAWLDDMASRGKWLQEIRHGFPCFEDTEPCITRHRIDAHPKDEATVARRTEEYRAFGWERVGAVNKYLDVYRAVDENAVELNTDEKLLHQALEKTVGKIHRSNVRMIVAILVVLAAMAWTAAKKGIFTMLMETTLARWGNLLLLLVFSFPLLLRMVRSYRRTRDRNLLERSHYTTVQAEERTVAQKKYWKFRSLVSIVLSILLLVSFGQGIEKVDVPLEDTPCLAFTADAMLPYEISQSEGKTAEMEHWLLSKQYTYFQRPRVGETYDITVYDAAGAWLARGYLKDIARQVEMEELRTSAYDKAIYYEGTPVGYGYYLSNDVKSPTKNLCFTRDNLLVLVRYRGAVDLRTVLKD